MRDRCRLLCSADACRDGAVEAAQRVLDRTKGEDEWQRRVDPSRVESISRFISRQENLIVNSALLFCSDSQSVKVDDTGVVTIDFSSFLNSVGGAFYLNHKERKDLRPIWLIDGQHRTRGLCLNENGYNLEIPIIFFPPGFDLSQSAKIFLEINTLQRALCPPYPLHAASLQHPLPNQEEGFQQERRRLFPGRGILQNHMSHEVPAPP